MNSRILRMRFSLMIFNKSYRQFLLLTNQLQRRLRQIMLDEIFEAAEMRSAKKRDLGRPDLLAEVL